MTAGKLAWVNARGRLRDYLTFLVSNCVLVAMFYIFAAIYYNEDIAFLKTSDTYKPAFLAFAVVVLVFSAVFIWYSSSFFVQKRKQEIATYMLVGMSKRQVSRMLFIEQILIGLISMAAGLLVGILFYKLFAMVLVNMVRVCTGIAFTVSVKGILVSIALFLVLYLLNAFFVSTLVHRVRLINLYKAKTIVEKKVRFNWFFRYSRFCDARRRIRQIRLRCQPYTDRHGRSFDHTAAGDHRDVPVYGVVFKLLFKWMSRNKNRYYKARNLTSLSQLKFRIKSNAVSLATIAILNAMVLTALGSMWSVYSTQEEEERYYQPFDMQYTAAAAYDDVDRAVDAVIAQHDENAVQGECGSSCRARSWRTG